MPRTVRAGENRHDMSRFTALTVLVLIVLVSLNLLAIQASSPWPGLVAISSITVIMMLAIVAFGRLSYRLAVERSAGRAAQQDLARLAHIDGLTVTGNRQPITSGSVISITDSTGVTRD